MKDLEEAGSHATYNLTHVWPALLIRLAVLSDYWWRMDRMAEKGHIARFLCP